MQRQDLNLGSLTLGPALLMTLSPKSEERVRRGVPHYETLPRGKGTFQGAESRLQVGLRKWKAPRGGSWTGGQTTPVPAPYSEALCVPPQPSSWRLLCHLPLPAMGDEETWPAAIACCLPSASPSRWLSGPLPAPTVSLGLACPGDLAPMITWAPSPALSLFLSLL